jgi:hypothetical protein
MESQSFSDSKKDEVFMSEHDDVGEVEVYLDTFITSSLHGGEWVSCMLWLLFFWGKRPHYPLDVTLAEMWSQYGHTH